ncbi:MAG TPA: 23S rRNA (pseudouridine(1915)-N(3))-methyltransferase RlmH [Gammaproteobacteria bacterium]|nr:23S rRNA (pseudouridine(1915)-N(3))-methyltransferase RlmH [Gammaproteobacteria bacterium]
MRIHLLAAGTRLPSWINAGFTEYAVRLPPECRLLLKEIPLSSKRRSGNLVKAIAEEGARMLAAMPAGACQIALDVGGRCFNTQELAKQLDRWLKQGRDLALMIGGPDGLTAECVQGAELTWSLSPLTLPHGLVRVVVAEQLYRAWTILKSHPYHRA